MDKLIEKIEKELKVFEEQGITSSNLGTIGELADVYKDLLEAEEKKKGRGEYGMRYPREGSRNVYMPIYRERGDYEYNGRMYGNEYMDDGYGRMNGRGGGSYRHNPMEHLFDKLNRILEHMEEYIDGKDRYHAGAHQGHMAEGLEKTMYAVCTLVESLMDSAETAEEKEIIRKHIEKINNI
jgi:hypothetical protein